MPAANALTSFLSKSLEALSADTARVREHVKLLLRTTMSVVWVRARFGWPRAVTFSVNPSHVMTTSTLASARLNASFISAGRSAQALPADTAIIQSPRRVACSSLVAMNVVLCFDVIFACPRAWMVSEYMRENYSSATIPFLALISAIRFLGSLW